MDDIWIEVTDFPENIDGLLIRQMSDVVLEREWTAAGEITRSVLRVKTLLNLAEYVGHMIEQAKKA